MKKILILCVRGYQKTLSPGRGIFRLYARQTCVFYPTCSDYAIEVIKKRGAIIGILLSIKRILRCHPWQKAHIDLP